eukprot:scaffold6137_cov159-Skeletonema_menzelii.AAC.4
MGALREIVEQRKELKEVHEKLGIKFCSRYYQKGGRGVSSRFSMFLNLPLGKKKSRQRTHDDDIDIEIAAHPARPAEIPKESSHCHCVDLVILLYPVSKEISAAIKCAGGRSS